MLCVHRCTGERVNGNLEGFGTAVFKDGHEYEVGGGGEGSYMSDFCAWPYVICL